MFHIVPLKHCCCEQKKNLLALGAAMVCVLNFVRVLLFSNASECYLLIFSII